ncbi:MAG: lysine--tRNA ligase [Deltaproteobacteria bacterium]|nr:lysine--tRNA ligase [Deltaproteobacteria bacterium]
MTQPPGDLRQQRLEKGERLKALGRSPWGNGYAPSHTAAAIHRQWGDMPQETLERDAPRVRVAGRVMMARLFGKAGFLQLQDRSGTIQIYCQKQQLSDEDFAVFQLVDIGDIVYAEGTLFYTKTGELTVHVSRFTIATKSLLPLPEKWHGLTDVEQRYRQRYLDLISNTEVKKTFLLRAQIVEVLRRYFASEEYLEVETPMMHAIPGGATARPFVTHHNTLDIDLFLRVAPELYLKRLVVGGLERVFEINRNFRNEGISTQHNPEFTMVEWYRAYATYEDLMRGIEQMLEGLCREVLGTTAVSYQETALTFTGPFRRYTMREAVVELGGVPLTVVDDPVALAAYARKEEIRLPDEAASHGVMLTAIFEARVEAQLIQPTFITHFPVEVSPLARRNNDDPTVTDRFELLICGREIANGFSELNDPIDQAERFRQQREAKRRGDDEAMYYDADFICALEHGMPPTAGAGLGIDRLVMLLTNAASIRDVILFPQLRP